LYHPGIGRSPALTNAARTADHWGEMARQKILILGSTGSIGVSTLDVVAALGERFEVAGLSAGRNAERLREQVRALRPRHVALLDAALARSLARDRDFAGVEIHVGAEGLLEMIRALDVDICVNGLLGAAGLVPTLEALGHCRRLALANKETLVTAGALVMDAAAARGVEIIPIDSEHSALHQCLAGRRSSGVARILLTASGGPFRSLDAAALARVTVEEALRHPTWRMGEKITIDSATLFNKGLEVIEAHWLFGLPGASLEVVIHPESIVHSLVEFVDRSVIAQLSVPDMRMPIQYALTYPERAPAEWPRLDLARVGALHFEPPDPTRFPCLRLAYEALADGGTMPAVLNAANEVAVAGFLGEAIPFGRIPALIETTMLRHETNRSPDLDAILEADRWARETVESLLDGAGVR
jgi:1-deoxy-D-xylulose-5-phosphate reductoisomerase